MRHRMSMARKPTWNADTGGSIVFSILTEKFIRAKNAWEPVTNSTPELLSTTVLAAESRERHLGRAWSPSDSEIHEVLKRGRGRECETDTMSATVSSFSSARASVGGDMNSTRSNGWKGLQTGVGPRYTENSVEQYNPGRAVTFPSGVCKSK